MESEVKRWQADVGRALLHRCQGIHGPLCNFTIQMLHITLHCGFTYFFTKYFTYLPANSLLLQFWLVLINISSATGCKVLMQYNCTITSAIKNALLKKTHLEMDWSELIQMTASTISVVRGCFEIVIDYDVELAL